jgi:alkanesulfonate monooxygenase SsuD/methylene tetrahydromethanopterin reductase-like flavin-dependent oxidoreductase (luciferase family)
MVIGGAGEQKTLRVVAKHADEWNWTGSWDPVGGPDEFARLSGILDEHCGAVGRDPSDIRRSFQLFVQPEDQATLDAQLSTLDEYEKRGAGHVVISFITPPSRALLETLASAE